MNFLVPYSALIVQGLLVTFITWLIAGAISVCIGTAIGIISCRALCLKWISECVRLYVFVAKGVPAYIQILIAYFVLPSLLGISIPGYLAATGALAFCSSGYVTEIIRAGINSINTGQWEACKVLGYSRVCTLRYIIVPQALRVILPTLLGELEQLLKSTCLLATIGVTDLTRTGMNIISRELNPLPVYLFIAACYLLFSAILSGVSRYVEKSIYN
jgi:His/Glu/Gln/Arg/opine family amino acid ABC transporter permease subunit